MDMLVASRAMVPSLLMGKYTRWAERLDAETLSAGLWAVGEFGSRYWAMGLPTPVFEPHFMLEERMARALKSFAIIRGTGRLRLEFGVASGEELSTTFPAFTQRYRDYLDDDPRTSWAVPLDEVSVASLLWEIGEYGVRVNSSEGPDGEEYPPPNFDGPPDQVRRMRVALKLIARVEGGQRITKADAVEIMSAIWHV